MEPVPGKLNQQHPIDRIHRAYREGCIEFAQERGYDVNEIAGYFEQFTFMRIREQGMLFNLAAFCAMQDVVAFFWKQGAEDAN